CGETEELETGRVSVVAALAVADVLDDLRVVGAEPLDLLTGGAGAQGQREPVLVAVEHGPGAAGVLPPQQRGERRRARGGGGAVVLGRVAHVLSRTVTVVGTTCRRGPSAVPASSASASRPARLPSSSNGWLTDVSGGSDVAATTVSSKPTIATSSGTRRPAAARARRAPAATRSDVAKMPSRSGRCRSSSSVARVPASSSYSPGTRGPGSTPAPRQRSAKPSSRSRPGPKWSGPARVARRRRPAASSVSAACLPPPAWSASTNQPSAERSLLGRPTWATGIGTSASTWSSRVDS